MPTNEERREVASSLKYCDIVCSGSGRYPYSLNGSVCGCMLVGQSDTAVRAATSFLADLIEPEPELVCPPDGVDWPVDADGLPLDPRATYELDGDRVRIWTIGYFRRGTADEVEIEYGDGDDYDAVDPRKLRKVVDE